ncbi:HlyD family secretion protein [Sediminibacterium sp. C3]|uniref:HlyD family secretion protein n=1 Tax=Sediminibacterium sp. C3 TaxID=1267211 RepID=UPI00040CC284|nr:HlyD family efflux transporter periplasmic adaptor subunit [Sediminibacterium sp. C3]
MKKYMVGFFGILLAACSNKNGDFDAQGVFETEEVMVSAEIPGKLLSFSVQEGDSLQQNQPVALLDSMALVLQKAQLQASVKALNEKTLDVNPQIELYKKQYEVQSVQLKNLQFEKNRIQELLKSDAATRKQMDDLVFQIESLEKQMSVTQQLIKVQQTSIGTQNRSILSEVEPLEKRIDGVEDQLKKSTVLNPLNGVVLNTYAEAGEVVGAGKPLYKIADINTMILRVYVTGDQLSALKIGQMVKVYVDQDKESYKSYDGRIIAIANKAEFTPKTIQTKDERANLVYAIKVQVKNDGYLKIGMYGEVKF